MNKLPKYIGVAIAFFIGINTEYFARRGMIGIITYIALFIAAVAIAMIRPRNAEK